MAKRSDLQLERDPSARFLPWVIALMVFLGCLGLAGALALDTAVGNWRRGVSDRLTVQIAAQTGQPNAPRVETAMRLLRETPGVAAVSALDERAVKALVQPWLGADLLGRDLPLPTLIDVQLDGTTSIDPAALASRLEAAVPGASIDDPRPWLERLVRLARVLQALGGGTALLIQLATIATVIFATRAGLAAHAEVIELLHLIGARDIYIVGQFQRHVLGLAALGGVIGVVAAGLAIVLLGLLAANVGHGILPNLDIGLAGWLVLLATPLVAIGLATLTARRTVFGYLRAMP